MNNTTNTVDTRPLMVSIRCITYNHEPYIRQCLDGFVMQKTNFRFEAIVHDDASTDGTADIIREYAEKYPDIIKPIFESENQYSKHDGSIGRIMDEACTGKYIAICEGDDYWTDPNKLQIQVGFLEIHPDYIGCFHNAMIKWETEDYDLELMAHYKEGEFSVSDILKYWPLPTASIVYRKELRNAPIWKKLLNIQGINGDIRTFMSCGCCGRVYGFSGVMSIYRKHAGGVSNVYEMHPEKYLRCDFTIVKAINNKELTAVLNKRVAGILAYQYMKLFLKGDSKGKAVVKVINEFNRWIPFRAFYLFFIHYSKVKIKSLINYDNPHNP